MMYKFLKIKTENGQRGFIALTATLVLTIVLMMLMFANNTSSFFARFDALGSENKRISLGLSESCSNAALLKLAQNYDYAGDEDVTVAGDKCHIEPIIINDSSADGKTVTIKTKAEHPAENGSWSTNNITATIKDPSYTSTAIPPVCNTFSLSPSTQINSGQTTTLSWDISGANTFTIQSITNSNPNPPPVSASLPSSSLVLSPTESTTYVGLATGANNLQAQCVASIKVKPSVGECADMMMVLDRSSSMYTGASCSGGSCITSEKNAAETLLDTLFDKVFPAPWMGVTRFGDASLISADVIASMTNVYGSRSADTSVGPNYPQATGAGGQWLSPNNAFSQNFVYTTDSTSGHTQTYKNFGFVIPSVSTINGIEVTTYAKNSSVTAQNKTVAPNSEGNYKSWNPNSGINNSANRVTSVASTGGTYLRMPSYSAVNNANTFIVANSVVPVNSTINSVTLYAVTDTVGGTSNIQLRVENGTGASNHKEDAGHVINNTAFTPVAPATISWPMAINPLTVAPWTYQEVNAWTTKFGIVRTNNTPGVPQVDQIYVVVNYTPPPLNIDLSWNNGSSWTTNGIKKVDLTNVYTSFVLGSSTDLWGEAGWDNTDFNDGNFLLRFTNYSSSLSLDYVKVKVYYKGPTGVYEKIETGIPDTNPGSYTNLGDAIKFGAQELNNNVNTKADGKKKVLILISDGTNVNKPCTGSECSSANDNPTAINHAHSESDNAKNNGTEIFTIHFGAASGRTLIAQLATNSANDKATPALENDDGDHFFISTSSTGADMEDRFNDIAEIACPALTDPASPADPPLPPPPPPPPPPIDIGSWDETIIP